MQQDEHGIWYDREGYPIDPGVAPGRHDGYTVVPGGENEDVALTIVLDNGRTLPVRYYDEARDGPWHGDDDA